MALRLDTEQQWETFFKDAEIPDDEAEAYAKIMKDNRIKAATLPDLNTELLKSLGITIIGDVLAIIRHAKSKCQATAEPASISQSAMTPTFKAPAAAAKLPSISNEMTHQQFRKIKIDWAVYKEIVSLPDSHVQNHLYSACAEEVQNSLINYNPDCLSMSEENFLNAIEKIVTKSINPSVHKMSFRKMYQKENESIKDYVIRLKSFAVDCEFTCPSCKVDISEINIKDQFITGINNEILQTDMLAKADKLSTLEEMIKHGEAFEGALRDQAQLLNPSSSISRISDHRKSKMQPSKSASRDYRKRTNCNGCGSVEHGIPDTPSRAQECPAWGKTCEVCQKPNHLSRVCYRKSPDTSARSLFLVAHVYYDADSDIYSVQQGQDDIQEIPAQLTPISTGSTFASATCLIFPDSGANICLAGTRHLPKLNLQVSQLHPCHKKVQAVGGSILICKGWINVKFVVVGHSTIQPMYFCEKVDRIYFSKQGCKKTNILSSSFPFPMQEKTPGIAVIEQSATGIPKESEEAPSNHHAQAAAAVPEGGSNEVTSTSHTKRTPPPAKPEKLLFPATEDNVPHLEAYLLKQFASSAFNKDAPFPAMNAPPAHIHLLPGSKPYARHNPIPVPYHWKEEVKTGLDEDVKRGILTKPLIGSSVTWCSPMVIVQKHDGSPRRTVDFQRLNAHCLRETHHTPSPFMLACQIPPNQKKTVIDAVDGYHAVKLDEESQPKTTFITEWGRYMYLRMPQGYLASGDAYTRRYDEITKDVKRKVKIIDDTLLYDATIEEAFYSAWDYLTLCANNGIVLNARKFKFCRDTVDFAGMSITPTGPAPSENILKAIRDFPKPTDITGARSWFGLVNQVAWAYAISPIMEPFREAIKPNRTFYWDENLTQIFEESKKLIIDMVKDGIRSFDTSRRTCLQTDWSRDGIGYLLLQRYCACKDDVPVCCPEGWKLVSAGSRFLTPTESRYSPTEGEALGVAWSLKHSRMFTLGCNNLLVVVDHKPLLGILNDRALDSITTPRLQNLKESTLGWRYDIKHCPGKWQRGPDALSRYPSKKPCIAAVNEIENVTQSTHSRTEDPAAWAPASLFHIICEHPTDSDIQATNTTTEHATSVFINSITCHAETVSIDQVKQAATTDAQYQDLMELIMNGFPQTRSRVQPPHLREFWGVHERLSCIDGIALMDSRVVIPRSLRKQILTNLHAANQGISSMKARANQTVYWPGMDAQMRNFKDTCTDCLERSPSQQPEPILLTPSPEWPFQAICLDYFELNGHSYLSIVDRFSGWLCIYYIKSGNLTSQVLISICRDLFIHYGAAEEISSDGGPQFAAKSFQEFLASWGVKHRLSSVGYPQSNGRAEVGVKAAKRIIHNNLSPSGSLDNDQAARAILQYRNTPLPDISLSPAQILFHRQLRDSVPSVPSHYTLHKEWILSAKERESALAMRTQKIIQDYNKSTRELTPLPTGMRVVVQSRDGKKKKWVKSGKIVEVLDNRQYRIRMDGSGLVSLQNRRFIKECCPITSPMILPSPSMPQQASQHQLPQQAIQQMSPHATQQVPQQPPQQSTLQASQSQQQEPEQQTPQQPSLQVPQPLLQEKQEPQQQAPQQPEDQGHQEPIDQAPAENVEQQGRPRGRPLGSKKRVRGFGGRKK